MYCEKCHNFLGEQLTDLSVCPACGTVNMTSSLKSQIYGVTSDTTKAEIQTPWQRKLRLDGLSLKFVSAVVLILAATLFSLVIALNVSASKRLDLAKKYDKNGDYQKVAEQLKGSDSFYIVPSIKNDAKKETVINKKWLANQKSLTKAEQLLKDKKYDECLTVLKSIPKDFPSYTKVRNDIDEVNRQIAAKKAADAAAAEAATQKAAAANQKKSTARSTANSLSCSAASGISGQRYVDTSAFNLIKNASNTGQVEKYLQSFLSQYGLSVEVSNINPDPRFTSFTSVTYETVTSSDLCSLKAYAMTFVDEWSKYPTDWITNSKLKKVVLDKNQHRVFSGTQYSVGATYDIYSSAMWYDVNYSGDYAREILHHEFYHLLLYNYISGSTYDFNTWNSYNTSGFSYGSGGASCYGGGGNCAVGEHPAVGFVTGYAESASAEDQAETYAYLMTNTYYKHLKSWLSGDSSLQSKVSFLKQLIASHSGIMTGSYFDQIDP